LWRGAAKYLITMASPVLAAAHPATVDLAESLVD
jgi:hypothetical protein